MIFLTHIYDRYIQQYFFESKRYAKTLFNIFKLFFHKNSFSNFIIILDL